MLTPASATPAAATLPLFLPQAPPDKVFGAYSCRHLARAIAGARPCPRQPRPTFRDGGRLRRLPTRKGLWVWKDAYEALEAGANPVSCANSVAPCGARRGLCRCDARHAHAGWLSGCRRRRAGPRKSQQLQQFSTPITLGLRRRRGRLPRQPADPRARNPPPERASLAIFAELAGARLALNEIAETARRAARPPLSRRRGQPAQRRADPRPSRSGDPPERGADEPAPSRPSPNVEGRFAEATVRHVGSALARLADGGRLVAVTGP